MPNKRGVVIGVNYTENPDVGLRGCHADAENMYNFLHDQVKIPKQNLRLLIDREGEMQPTKQNILDSLAWLTDYQEKGDSLFLHYSGHGAQVDDESGDEIDGKDEILLPCDFKTNGFIVDDDLTHILVKKVKEGVRLTVITDCCHSGTMLDLGLSELVRKPLTAEEFENKKKEHQENQAKKAEQESSGASSGGSSMLLQIVIFFFTTFFSLIKGTLKLVGVIKEQPATKDVAITGEVSHHARAIMVDEAKHKTQVDMEVHEHKPTIILFSGCQDDQCSADTVIDGKATGAVSHAFLRTLKEANYEISYLELLNKMRQRLQEQKSIIQIPQISYNRHDFKLEDQVVF